MTPHDPTQTTDPPDTLPAIPEPGPLAVELAERRFALIERQAAALAASAIVPAQYRSKPANIIAAGLYGATFGWDVTTSMRNIHVIDGKPSLATEALVGLVHRAGHTLTGDVTATEATARGRRNDTGSEQAVTYTIDDAKTAGLTGKTNWQKFPKSMLWARAVSQLCRQLFPDVTLGTYVEDELEPIEAKRSAPAGSPSTPAAVEDVRTVGEIVDMFDLLDAADQATIDAKVIDRYSEAHPDITGVYALADGVLPQAQIDLLHDYVAGFEPVVDAELVTDREGAAA